MNFLGASENDFWASTGASTGAGAISLRGKEK